MKKLPVLFFLLTSFLSLYAQEKKVQIENKHQAEIRFEEEKFDFGWIKEDTLVTHEFIFENTGDSLLIVYRIDSPCSCMDAKIPGAPIKPGEKGVVQVKFNSKDRPGPFTKNFVIISNSKTSPQKITISGTVGKGAATAPPTKIKNATSE